MSAIISGGIGAFIGFLLAQGFQKVQASTGKDGTFNIFGNNSEGKPFSVKIANPALKSPQYGLVNISSTALKKPDKPDLTFANEGSGIKKIFTIGIIPTDAATKTNGILEVILNGARVFPIGNPAAGMFTGVSSINIPIPANFGLKINESDSLDFNVWSGGGAVNFTVAVFLANEG